MGVVFEPGMGSGQGGTKTGQDQDREGPGQDVIRMGQDQDGKGPGQDRTRTGQDQDGMGSEWEDGTGSGRDIPHDYEFIT